LPIKYGAEAVEIPGSRKVLTTLGNTPWAIVTSGSEPLIEGWLKVMSITHPPVLVSAEGVKNGKPDPEGYKLAREKLGISSEARVLVVEDAPAGIRAGKAAGCDVLALVTSHSAAEVESAEPDWVIKDLLSFKVLGWDEEKKVVKVEISNALKSQD
jgi:glycerol 3-phosphatase-1